VERTRRDCHKQASLASQVDPQSRVVAGSCSIGDPEFITVVASVFVDLGAVPQRHICLPLAQLEILWVECLGLSLERDISIRPLCCPLPSKKSRSRIIHSACTQDLLSASWMPQVAGGVVVGGGGGGGCKHCRICAMTSWTYSRPWKSSRSICMK